LRTPFWLWPGAAGLRKGAVKILLGCCGNPVQSL
jgi:hypothetical protein